MITAGQARELLRIPPGMVSGGELHGALRTVIAQAEQITAARDFVNDLQGGGVLQSRDADALLAILKDQP